MKTYFDLLLVDKAVKHAQKLYPEESCGFFIDNDYMPMENIAEDKVGNFRIDPTAYIKFDGHIDAIVHSHANYPHASKADMEGQIRSAVPWGIISLKESALENVVFWGDQIEPQELLGRPFFHGIYDCYGLVRDYYRMEGITIPQYPRENLWWETDPSLLENYVNDADFYRVDESEIKKGDVVFFKIGAPVVNHCAVYLGNNIIFHHLYARLSRRTQLSKWRSSICGYYRYAGGK